MKANKRVRRATRDLFRLCVVNGAFDEGRARQVAQRIGASGRRGALHVLCEFQRLVRLDRDRYTAVVESATPLAEPLRRQIGTTLVDMYGPALDTSFVENPTLIAGVRIRVGSDVYDGSIRAKLAALETAL